MSGDFAARLDELRTRTGCREGRIEAVVTVDQVYAHYQHEHLEFHHPRGGIARYLAVPLMLHFREYLAEYAASVTRDGGQRAMENAAEHLSDEVEIYAPLEFADLRRSGHPQVRLGARIVYDRRPKQHRLTEQELRAKNRLRQLPPEILGWIWWHVMGHTEPPPRHSRWAG